MADYYGAAYARQDTTVSSTAITLLRTNWGATSKRPRMAVIAVETASIRVTLNGTAPNNGSTPPVGTVFTDGQVITLIGQQNIEQFKAIKSGVTDAVIHVEFFA